MSTMTLSTDQQAAWDQFQQFLLDPDAQVFVLSGHSGTGKTTLVQEFVELVPAVAKTIKLINPKKPFTYSLQCAATTNKAAEALSDITGQEVQTIHSVLGLRVQQDIRTGSSHLITTGKDEHVLKNKLLFIDEASYIDSVLLDYIFKFTDNCKIVFIGDPYQLTKAKTRGTPVFNAGFDGAHLSQVVRQLAGNPIVDLATKFRETVKTGELFKFSPDGHYIRHLNRDDFDEAVVDEFSRPDWKHNDSKVLAWTNKTAIAYNQAIRNINSGSPDFFPGDYAICNDYYSFGKSSFRTDETVQILDISRKKTMCGLEGHVYSFTKDRHAFMPDDLQKKKELLKFARKHEDWALAREICENWIDLRAAYSCTINKSQGSTYDQVFIDLDDIKKCNSINQIARLLYVAVSRARYHVTFTGDLV